MLERLDLERAMAVLPDKQRQTVAYHYLIGLPYAEVAEILGGSVDAARKAASEGIRALRVALDGPTRRTCPTTAGRTTERQRNLN